MKSMSLPGMFDVRRHEHALLHNELDAIHGGGVARFFQSFDVRKIYRNVAPSASDVFGHYRYSKVFSQFDIPAVLETRMISDFNGRCRTTNFRSQLAEKQLVVTNISIKYKIKLHVKIFKGIKKTGVRRNRLICR